MAHVQARWRGGGGVALIFWAAPVLGVTMVNRLLSQEWIWVAWNGGINFFLGNNASASGWSATTPELRPSWWLGYLDAIQIASRDLGHTARPGEVSIYWYTRGLEFIRSEPLAWLRLMARKCYLLLNSFEFSNNQSIQGFFAYSPLFRIPIGFGAMLSLSAPQLVSRKTWREPFPWYLTAYGLTVVAFFVTSRYRMPLVPLLLLLAARTTVEAGGALRALNWRKGLKLGVPAALAAFVTTSDWTGVRDPDIAEQHFNLGNRYAQSGAYEQAVAEYEAALRARPYHMGAWNNIGTVRLRQGRLPEARRVLEQSLALHRTPEAHARIGMAYLQEGQLDSARAALGRSLALTADNPEALYYLGSVEVAAGRVPEAIAAWERALGLHPDPSFRENVLYALGKLYVRSGADVKKGADYLGRITANYPDLEELKREAASKGR